MNCPTCGHAVKTKKAPIAKYIKIKPGKFLMGSPANEAGRWDDELQHEVTITRPYEIAATPITQAQWVAVMGTNPSRFTGDLKRPVENVSWDDVQAYIAKLNAAQSNYTYRLPTEAEWEYAARAGTTTPYPFSFPKGTLGECAWYKDNSGCTTHPVGTKAPNAWGLYDMFGNVWEWCQDRHGEHKSKPTVDPVGPRTGSYRVFRGGSWGISARGLRAACRSVGVPGDRHSGVGARLVRGLR